MSTKLTSQANQYDEIIAIIEEAKAYAIKVVNADGTSNGISGTVPDIVSEEGSGALETCLMAINGELNY